MGIYDRDYYRKDAGRFHAWASNAPACRALIILTLVLLVLQILFRDPLPNPGWFTELFGFRGDAILRCEVWRLVTGALLPLVNPHSLPFLGLLFNLLFLWWFGREVEELYGTREFLGFYFAAALAGTLATLGFAASGNTGLRLGTPVACGTGAITAVLLLFAMHYPRRTILVLFILPVPIWIVIGFQILMDFSDLAGGGVSAFGAHLGGAAFALLYYYSGMRLTNWLPGRGDRPERAERPRRPQLRVFRDEETAPPEPVAPPASPTAVDEALEAKVDALLEKVAQHGQESLTDNEREILFRASEIYKRKRKSQ